MPAVAPENRVTQSEKELHVGLDVPRNTSKRIHHWVMNQTWPEGTEIEHPTEYHVTLLYSPEGHDEHKDAWWLEHLEQAQCHINGIKAFPAKDRGYAYVLTIESDDVSQKAEEMQGRAEWAGLPITHFDGGYKPHLTVAYGPTSRLTGIKPPNFEFDIGPSSVSPPRSKTAALEHAASQAPEPPNYRPATSLKHCGNCKMFDRGKCWGYGNKKVERNAVCDSWASSRKSSAELLDHLSLSSVAHNLHYRYQESGMDAATATDYTHQLLKLLGYPIDEITTVAAIQAWQQMYPDDKITDVQEQGNALQAPATTPTPSYPTHIGSMTRLSHAWTEAEPIPGPNVGIRADRSAAGTPFEPSETLEHHRVGGRNTGHFGTGLYFVSTPEAAGSLGRDHVRGVDLSGSNLYRPVSNKDAYGLHDDLSVLNDFGNQGTHAYDGRGWRGRRQLSDLIWLPQGILPATQAKMKAAVDQHHADLQAGNYNADTASTNFMRSMGYDGIDTRHLNTDADSLSGLDNTMYGSVLYRPSQQAITSEHIGASEKFGPSDKSLCYPLRESVTKPPVKPDDPNEQFKQEDRDSTVPSEVGDPDDHWPEFGQTPPDKKRDVQFSNDWNIR